MLFGETVAVYCENHTEHTDTLSGQNAEFLYAEAGGTYSNHWPLKGQDDLQSLLFERLLIPSASDRVYFKVKKSSEHRM
jgi:hypothetical protein